MTHSIYLKPQKAEKGETSFLKDAIDTPYSDEFEVNCKLAQAEATTRIAESLEELIDITERIATTLEALTQSEDKHTNFPSLKDIVLVGE